MVINTYLGNGKWIVPSDSKPPKEYLVDVWGNFCGCKAFQYCKTEPKVCKHLKRLKKVMINGE